MGGTLGELVTVSERENASVSFSTLLLLFSPPRPTIRHPSHTFRIYTTSP